MKTFSFHVKTTSHSKTPLPLLNPFSSLESTKPLHLSKSNVNMLSLFGIDVDTDMTDSSTPTTDEDRDTKTIHVSTSLFDEEHIDCVEFLLHETGVDDGEIDLIKKEIVEATHVITSKKLNGIWKGKHSPSDTNASRTQAD